MVSSMAAKYCAAGVPRACDPHVGERHEHVVAQEARQRHVPALPEILDAGGAERRVEIERQLDAEQQAEADRDVGIAGEVEEDLEPEAERQPGDAVVQRSGAAACA